MDDWAHSELEWLTAALRGHLLNLRGSGAHGTLACDEQWLARRRQQYRDFPLPHEPPIPAAPETPSLDGARSPEPATSAEPEPDTRPASAAKPDAAPAAAAAPAPPRAITPIPEPPPPSPAVPAPPQPPSAAAATARSFAAVPAAPPPPAPQPVAPQPKVPQPAARSSAASLPVIRPREPGGRVDLVALEADVRACTRCGLHETRTNTVFARGTGSSGICFIGEGPGADEDAQGSPFVGKAGQLLDKMIAAMGMNRDDVYVCNVVKCRPPNNRKPAPREMAECRPFLQEQLEAIAPKVIVALGGTALEGLLGISVGITRARGQWRLYQGKIPVMPTFHPAYLLRQPQAKREVWEDLQQVLQHLGLSAPKR